MKRMCLATGALIAAAQAWGASAPMDATFDYHSYANVDQFRVTHLELDLRIDLKNKEIDGIVGLEIKRLDPRATRLVLDTIGRRAAELDQTILLAADVFDAEFRTTYAGVYSWGVLSKAWRWIKRLLGKRYFNDADLRLISSLLQIGSNLAAMIDTKILDQEGQPQ